jgi:hypothetical protein
MDLLSYMAVLCRGGDAQGHGHEEHMPEHNGHLFGEEVRGISCLCRRKMCMHADQLNHSLFQPGKPRKSEGWEKIYVASFGAGALSSSLPCYLDLFCCVCHILLFSFFVYQSNTLIRKCILLTNCSCFDSRTWSKFKAKSQEDGARALACFSCDETFYRRACSLLGI